MIYQDSQTNQQKGIIMLVCLNCWEVLDYKVMNREFTKPLWCPKKNCGGGEVVDIDECLIPAIKDLNEKGYFTDYCCSGHYWEFMPDSEFHGGTYIRFSDDVQRIDLPKLPPGFIMDAEEGNGGVTIRKPIKSADPASFHIAILKTAIDVTKWAKGLKDLMDE
jgi:hypothetical protein